MTTNNTKEFYDALEKLTKDTGKTIFEVLQEYPHMRDWQKRIVEGSKELTESTKKEVLED